MKVIKTKKFDLFGSEWTIKFIDSIKDEENPNDIIYGRTDLKKRIIYISTEGIKESEQKITLYHELFHAILTSGQYNTCSSDEPLVEWLARSLNCLKRNKIV